MVTVVKEKTWQKSAYIYKKIVCTLMKYKNIKKNRLGRFFDTINAKMYLMVAMDFVEQLICD